MPKRHETWFLCTSVWHLGPGGATWWVHLVRGRQQHTGSPKLIPLTYAGDFRLGNFSLLQETSFLEVHDTSSARQLW
jgi:hypothetical protein